MARPLILAGGSYLTGFFLFTLATIGGLSWWLLDRVETLQRLALEESHEAARQETLRAIESTLERLQRHLDQLAGWDETRQQLADPSYYAYWRENRVLRAGQLPDFVLAVELYRGSGDALMPLPGWMPVRMPAENMVVENESGGVRLYLFHPVNEAEEEGVRGHVGIKVDLRAALIASHRFRYLDTRQLLIADARFATINAETLSRHMLVRPAPLPESVALVDLIHDGLLKLVLVVIFLGVVALFMISLMIQQPLARLTRHIDRLRAGENLPLGEGANWRPRVRELEKIRLSLNDYQSELATMESTLAQKNDELHEVTARDLLTGLPNRRSHSEEWKHLVELIRGRDIGVTLMLFDCDHFKAINDSYGHDVGDQVIRVVAECLSRMLNKNDRLYRLGGDEFVMHMVNTSLNEAEERARRCQVLMGQYPFHERLGIRESVRFSIGLAYANGRDGETLAHLLKQADIAVCHAKRPGSGKVVRYTVELGQETSAMVSSRYLHAVYQAVEHGIGLELHFQPIVELGGGAGHYYEVLTRLRDEEGLISPAYIFPVIASEQLEREFDLRLLNHLHQRLVDGEIPDRVGLSINLDGSTIGDPEVGAALHRLAPALERHKLVLEVTETALISDLARASKLLQGLRERGFLIALDDFGSGYSSLRYLSTMPVDIVKFDISMVRDLQRNDAQRQISETMAGMIRQVGYQLVAEGVENQALLDHVRKIGFTHAQGFHIGRPSTSVVPIVWPPAAGE